MESSLMGLALDASVLIASEDRKLTGASDRGRAGDDRGSLVVLSTEYLYDAQWEPGVAEEKAASGTPRVPFSAVLRGRMAVDAVGHPAPFAFEASFQFAEEFFVTKRPTGIGALPKPVDVFSKKIAVVQLGPGCGTPGALPLLEVEDPGAVGIGKENPLSVVALVPWADTNS